MKSWQGLTVQELIARLEDLPPDMELNGRCDIIRREYNDGSWWDVDLGLYGGALVEGEE